MNTFGFFNREGVNGLYELLNKFDGRQYLELLKDKILPELRSHYPQPQKVYFVQDQCPVHKAKIVTIFLKKQENLIIIQLPVKGSDMNLIENI